MSHVYIPIHLMGSYKLTQVWMDENQRREILWRQYTAQKWVIDNFAGC